MMAERSAERPHSDPLGVVAVFASSLSLSRKGAADLAARHRMEVGGIVTKATIHLVVGDQYLAFLAGHRTSSKHRKAEQMRADGHPIRILGETKFWTSSVHHDFCDGGLRIGISRHRHDRSFDTRILDEVAANLSQGRLVYPCRQRICLQQVTR